LFLLDGLGGDTFTDFVVGGLGGSWSLGMPKSREGDVHWYWALAIDEEASEFAFSDAGKNGFQDFACEDR
jgi:hypothetical protein